jgi:predicted dehydrogenase
LAMKKDQITIGVVGCGYWGPNLIRNFHDDDRAEVKFICDRMPERLDKLRKRYRGATFTTEYNDLLNDPGLDTVVIATPVHTHFALAKEALLAGKHVLVEKPMCMNSAECLELIAIAEERKLTLMVDHTFVYHGPVRLIKNLIEKKELGDLLYFNSVRVNLGLFQPDVNVLWDLAAHDLAIMDYLINQPPRSVHATGASHTGTGIEDIAYLTLSFDNNIIAHFHVSWLSPVKIRQVSVGGHRKMVVFNDAVQAEKVHVYDKGIDTLDEPQTDQERYSQLIQYRYGDMHAPVYDLTEALKVETQHFIDCVLTGKKPISDGQSGLRVVKLLELANASLKSGRTQQVENCGVR